MLLHVHIGYEMKFRQARTGRYCYHQSVRAPCGRRLNTCTLLLLYNL